MQPLESGKTLTAPENMKRFFWRIPLGRSREYLVLCSARHIRKCERLREGEKQPSGSWEKMKLMRKDVSFITDHWMSWMRTHATATGITSAGAQWCQSEALMQFVGKITSLDMFTQSVYAGFAILGLCAQGKHKTLLTMSRDTRGNKREILRQIVGWKVARSSLQVRDKSRKFGLHLAHEIVVGRAPAAASGWNKCCWLFWPVPIGRRRLAKTIREKINRFLRSKPTTSFFTPNAFV